MKEAEPAPDDPRAMFAALSIHSRPGDGCPAADTIWDAVSGELPPGETQDLVDHLATCGSCAEAWRLARDLAPAPAVAPTVQSGLRSLVYQRPLAMAASIAALAIVSVAGIYVLQRESNLEPPTYRQGDDVVTIRSLIDERTPVPRDRCVLAWSPGPAGSTYTVRMSREDLTVVAIAERLDRAEYQVPRASLDSIPAGARLFWQVEAVVPGGRRVVSPTFIAVVQ